MSEPTYEKLSGAKAAELKETVLRVKAMSKAEAKKQLRDCFRALRSGDTDIDKPDEEYLERLRRESYVSDEMLRRTIDI